MNRRKFLALTGGGVIVAAGAGVAGFILTRTPHKALIPWSQAGSLYSEPRKRALSYAILAPNPHNRQPWQIDLSTENKIILHVDTDRLLPHTDPFNRQITIGLGCFLEILRMAAAEDGYRVTMETFPEGSGEHLDKRPVAILSFDADETVKKDPLFANVLERRSLKVPYDMKREIPNTDLTKLIALTNDNVQIMGTNDTSKVADLRHLTNEASTTELHTHRMNKESIDLMRVGKSEIEANPDGIDLGGPFLEALSIFGLFTREGALDPASSVFKQGQEILLSESGSAMGHVWLVTKGNSRLDQLNAGRDWVRVNLTTTSLGLGLHPHSQALQEWPEMKEHYDKCHALLAPNGGTVQMLGRLGYGEKIGPSPRWPLDTRIIDA
ncbi:MAG: twin-arginine translocation pathway signal protein [Rhizobiaceae bacterium]|nr:twin-arginine translocation pathway signal protein [Rhizobiaceae bacterium]